MGNYTVIAKGKYTHEQTNDVLHVERFLIVRRKKRRILLLDLNNLAKETLTELRLQIEQFDARGNALGEKLVEVKKLAAKFGSFVLKKEIELHRSCIDFRVKIVCANYGNYAYRLGDNDTYITYETPKKRVAANKQRLQEELGEGGFSARLKKHRVPVFVGVFSALVLAASGVLSYLHLREFKDGRDHFFLNNIKYEYTEEELTADTPLRVIGYVGLGGDKITVPNTVDGHPVTSVKADAFAGNGVLKQLTVQSGVLIEEGAFSGCHRLEKVVLEGDSAIGARAFYDCNSLKTVEAENVSVIGESAFGDCDELRTLRIVSVENDEMMTIEDNAFAACGDFDEIYIDRYVAYPVECNYFLGTTEVDTLYLRNYNSEAYEGIGNNVKKLNELFGGEETEVSVKALRIAHTDGIPEYFTQYTGEDLESFVVDNLKRSEIGAYAFTDCSKMTKLSFPKLISTIGAYAFAGSGVTTFDGSALTSMGVSAFSGCLKLKEFFFQETTLLNVIPDGAFGYAPSLQRIFIPSAVTSVGNLAFVGCTSLSSLTFGEGSRLTTLYDGAFSECTALRRVILPDGVQEIKSKAFAKCKALRYISLPNSIDTLGEDLFEYCYKLYEIENLSDITIRAGEGLGYYTLKVYTDTEENEPRIPKHTVGDYVIADVDGTHYLIEYEGKGGAITLPNGINDTPYILTSYLFIETKHVTAVNIPASVEKIGRQVFFDSNTETVKFTSGVGAIELDSAAFTNCTQLKELDLGAREVPVIDNGLLSGCIGLERLGLSDKTTSIADGALAGFAALSRVYGGDAVQSVGSSAFADCQNLEYYEFGDALLYIGDSAFQGCVSLKSFSNANFVRSIGNSAFKWCSSLGSVSLSDTLLSLGARAFEGCSAMTSVSGADQLSDIPESAFASCTGITYVALPDALVSVSANAFNACSSLSTIAGGENLVTVGDYAFYRTALTAYSFPSRLREIGAYAFAENTRLETLSGGADLRIIGDSAFQGCTALQTFAMPQSLEMIGASAFMDCTALTRLTGGGDLWCIGDRAFCGCTALSLVYLPAELTDIRDNAFAECPALHEIYNLSSLFLTKDGTEYGYVAYNAIVIHTSLIDTPLRTLSLGDHTFKVYKNEYTLTSYKGRASSLTLDRLSGVTEYAVARYAFKDLSTLQRLTIGSAVTSVRSQAFLGLTGLREVRFNDGVQLSLVDWTFDDCANLQAVVIPDSLEMADGNAFGGSFLSYYSRNGYETFAQPYLSGAWYYYDECIHDNESMPKWNYQNGEINTQPKSYDRYETLTEPTCTRGGWKREYCSVCGSRGGEVSVAPKGHNYSNGSNGVCGRCGHVKELSVNESTYDTANELLEFTTVGSWDIFGANSMEIRSANKDGKVILTITAREAVTLSLECVLVGESCQLSYFIYYGDQIDLTQNGEQLGVGPIDLQRGESITFTFTKEKLTETTENEDGEPVTVEKENPAYAIVRYIEVTQHRDPSMGD